MTYIILFLLIVLLILVIFIKNHSQKKKNLEIKSLAVVLVNSQSKDDVNNLAKKIFDLAN